MLEAQGGGGVSHRCVLEHTMMLKRVNRGDGGNNGLTRRGKPSCICCSRKRLRLSSLCVSVDG